MDWSKLRDYIILMSILSTEFTNGVATQNFSDRRYGKLIGPINGKTRNIAGIVYAVDESTLFVRNFSYDAAAPDSFFWVGKTKRPSPFGYLLAPPENYGATYVPALRTYDQEDLILRIPEKDKVKDLKWLCIWCRRFTVAGRLQQAIADDPRMKSCFPGVTCSLGSHQATGMSVQLKREVVGISLNGGPKFRGGWDCGPHLKLLFSSVNCINFGEIMFPPNLEVPKARVLPEFKRLAHGLRSGNITILDSKTFYIPNLHYDGTGPDAYFWVGNGSEPNSFGVKVPNEMKSLSPLRGYQGEDIEIVLPGNLTVYDIDWLAVWCVEYRHNFGHVIIPKDLDVPPAVGQTKITPPWWYNPTSSTTQEPRPERYSNCKELLDERLQVQWELQGDWVQIRLAARIRDDQYMAFGLSGESGRSSMIGGDVVVAFYDADRDNFRADDYYMSATFQCDGKNGVCPDRRIGGRNDIVLASGEKKNGVTTIVYRRLLQTNEPIKDRAIPSDGEINVIAAIGPLNSRKEANAHAIPDKTIDDIRIDFSSRNDHTCTTSLYNVVDDYVKPWNKNVIMGENQFTVRIGPTGGKRGYTPITGRPAWKYSWYINDKLIPEIYVERGQTYVFKIEGGNDRTNAAKYHPFYITDSKEGGFGKKRERDQKMQRIFAGVAYDGDGYPYPTSAGRFCEYVPKTIDRSLESDTFEEYFSTLKLKCDEGSPAYLNWTVPMEAPDILYYQCYTHNNLGWKIHVVSPGFHSTKVSGAMKAFDRSLLGFYPIFWSLIFTAVKNINI